MKKGLLFTALTAIAAVSMAWAAETLWLHRADGITMGLPISKADSITVDASRQNVVIVGVDRSTTNIPRADLQRITMGDATNVVDITFAGADVTVVNPRAFEGVTVEKNGADVVVVAEDAADVVYRLSGATEDGSVSITSTDDFSLALNGVEITNADGAAIELKTERNVAVQLCEGTQSKLVDASTFAAVGGLNESACLYSEGSLTFTGGGALSITAGQKTALFSKRAVEVNGAAVSCVSSFADAISAGSFRMESGSVVAQGADSGSSINCTDGSFIINGGKLIAMAGNCTEPTEYACNQYYVLCTIPSVAKGAAITVKDEAGKETTGFIAVQDYADNTHLLISEPSLKVGSTYSIFAAGAKVATFEAVEGTASATWRAGEIEDVESTKKDFDYGEVKIGDYYYSDGSWSDGGFLGFDRTGNGKVLWASPKPAPTYTNPYTGAARKVIGIVYTTDLSRMGEAEKQALKEKGVKTPHGLVMASRVILAQWDNGLYDESGIGLSPIVGATPEDLYPTLNAIVSGYKVHKIMTENRKSEIAKGDYPVLNNLVSGAVDKYYGGPAADVKSTGWYVPAPAQMFDIIRNFSGLDYTENPEWYYPETTTRFNWQRDKYLSFWTKYPENLIELINVTLSTLASTEKDDFPTGGDVNYMTSIFPSNDCYYCMPICEKYVSCEPIYKTNIQPVRFVLAF